MLPLKNSANQLPSSAGLEFPNTLRDLYLLTSVLCNNLLRFYGITPNGNSGQRHNQLAAFIRDGNDDGDG